MIETFAKLKYSRISAQKVRLVIDQVRGLKVDKAMDWLTLSPKKASKIVKKVLQSAMANAEHNFAGDVDELKISKVFVDEGPTLKRFRARAKGRGNQILKRTCHITVFVSDGGGA